MTRGVGRVFFRNREVGDLRMIALQPLVNHQENVKRLFEAWPRGKDDLEVCEETEGYLREALRFHDAGKVSTLRILQVDEKGRGDDRDVVKRVWSYSFKGHRFAQPDGWASLYARELDRMHHDFSTEGVVTACYRIQTQGEAEERRQARRFPADLYILTMCDQIEAVCACMAFGEYSEEKSNRAYMEFHVCPEAMSGHPVVANIGFPYGEGPFGVRLDPAVFAEDVTLRLEYRVKELEGEVKMEDLMGLAESLDDLPARFVTAVIRGEG